MRVERKAWSALCLYGKWFLVHSIPRATVLRHRVLLSTAQPGTMRMPDLSRPRGQNPSSHLRHANDRRTKDPELTYSLPVEMLSCNFNSNALPSMLRAAYAMSILQMNTLPSVRKG